MRYTESFKSTAVESYQKCLSTLQVSRQLGCSIRSVGRWVKSRGGKLRKSIHGYLREVSLNPRKEYFTIVCEYCGKVWKVPPWRKNKRFCNQICYGKWQSGVQVGRNNPLFTSIEVICKNCEEKFNVWPSRIKRGQGEYCSTKCAVEAEAYKHEGEDHFNWQGGKSFEPYGIEFDRKLKAQIRNRDNQTCQMCHRPRAQLKRILSVHHIDYNKRNNDSINLISLCIGCHTRTNYNREYYTPMFQKKMIVIGIVQSLLHSSKLQRRRNEIKVLQTFPC